jgi:hypothetical protein
MRQCTPVIRSFRDLDVYRMGLDHALGCEYIMAARHAELDAKWNHIGAMLNRVIETADSFCKPADTQPRKK